MNTNRIANRKELRNSANQIQNNEKNREEMNWSWHVRSWIYFEKLYNFIHHLWELSRTKRIFNVPFKSNNGIIIVGKKSVLFFSVLRFCSISKSKYYYQITTKHLCYSNELDYVHFFVFFTKKKQNRNYKRDYSSNLI